MRAVLVIVVAMLAGVASSACTEPRNPRCNAVCRREADCTKGTDTFDQNECVAACSALLADDKNAAKVERHMDCVNKASCPTLLECP
jgi:hypothetical protein